jgi:hypothetical protein
VVTAGLTLTAAPLVAGRLPGVITPVPFANTPVRLALPPTVIVAGVAAKLVIVGVDDIDDPDPPHPATNTKHTLSAAA